MEKTTIKLYKPIYLGMSILDLSKTLMYKFHYEYVKPKWEDKVTLLFTDTDSLCYEIRTDDAYKDISGDVDEWLENSTKLSFNQIRKIGNRFYGLDYTYSVLPTCFRQ